MENGKFHVHSMRSKFSVFGFNCFDFRLYECSSLGKNILIFKVKDKTHHQKWFQFRFEFVFE